MRCAVSFVIIDAVIFGGNEMKVVICKPGKLMRGILRMVFGVKKDPACE